MYINKNQTSSLVNLFQCKNCWLDNFQTPVNSSKALSCKTVNRDVITYSKGEYLVENGDLVFGVFCIESGRVKVSIKGNKNKEFVLWIVGKGDIVGLNSFVNNEPFSFTASAIDEVKVCFIPAEDLKILLEKEPIILSQLMKNLCAKLNFIEQRITSISKKKIREQSAEMLIYLAMKNSSENKKNIIIDYSINDLANLIGTTKNYLYKIFLEFASKEILSLQKKKWVIKDLDALSLIANGGQ